MGGDVIDQAQDAEAAFLGAALRNARAADDGLRPMFRCYYCNEILGARLLFCDADCRDDWQRERAARLRSGT